MVLDLMPFLQLTLDCREQEPEDKMDEAVEAIPLKVKFDGTIKFHMNLSLPPHIKLTEGAPRRWSLHLPGENSRLDVWKHVLLIMVYLLTICCRYILES